jgi:hypothetical protein
LQWHVDCNDVGAMQPSKYEPRKSRAAHRRVCPREAYITDPGALLEALASAGLGERDAQGKVQQPVEACHTEPLAPAPEPPPSRPSLHENERLAHAASSGAIVIVRRRRAA